VDEVQNKESGNIMPLPETFRREFWVMKSQSGHGQITMSFPSHKNLKM
jgi:hypothetical protein